MYNLLMVTSEELKGLSAAAEEILAAKQLLKQKGFLLIEETSSPYFSSIAGVAVKLNYAGIMCMSYFTCTLHV